MDKKNEEIKKDLITINITTKGRAKLLDILQDHLGYIEEENHEQILNGIQEWMNENYAPLLEFYTKVQSKGLVPAVQMEEILQENKRIKEQIKGLDISEAMKEPEDKDSDREPSDKEPEDEKFQPISPDMNGWDLRRLAKKMGIPLTTGLSKEMIYDMVQEELKGRNKS